MILLTPLLLQIENDSQGSYLLIRSYNVFSLV